MDRVGILSSRHCYMWPTLFPAHVMWHRSVFILEDVWTRKILLNLTFSNLIWATFICVNKQRNVFGFCSVTQCEFWYTQITSLCSCLLALFYNRDMFHGIRALDPDRLNVFRTVREITGERQSPFITRQAIKLA